MMNGKQRARWIADAISDLQRIQKQSRGKPEDGDLTQALENLRRAREKALADAGAEDGRGG